MSANNNDNFLRIPIKDWIYIIAAVVSITGFSYTMSNKIDNVAAKMENTDRSINEIKQDRKDERAENKVFLQSLQNQVNSNTLQIELIKKEIQTSKEYRR